MDDNNEELNISSDESHYTDEIIDETGLIEEEIEEELEEELEKEIEEELEEIEEILAKAGSSEKKEEPINIRKEIVSWILIIVIALGVSSLVNKFVIVNATIPTGSMEDTIMTGDRIIGWRFAYTFGEPKRGDIIIFKYPDNENENYVKRIIGLPGELIKIKNGKIYVNDSTEPLEEDYIKEAWNWSTDQVYVIPEDSYFMLGDNRNNSNDSRYWANQFVKRDKILGRASFCYWPLTEFGFLD